MATICDSCFESATGILPEADFPFDPASADRLYCVDGRPTAPPSNGAVQTLGVELTAAAISGLTNGSSIPLSGGSLTWTNTTGRSATVVAMADASCLSDAQPLATYVELAYSFSLSDASTLATMHIQLPLMIGTLGSFSPSSGSCNSLSKVVAPGVTITVSATATFRAPLSGTSWSILNLSSSLLLMGAI